VISFVYFNYLPTSAIYTLSLHDALPILLKDSTKGNYYVAEKNKKVIGSLLTTFEWSDWRNGTVLWIQSVYVVPEFRRKGVYSKRSEEHTSELQSRENLVCRLLLEKKKQK